MHLKNIIVENHRRSTIGKKSFVKTKKGMCDVIKLCLKRGMGGEVLKKLIKKENNNHSFLVVLV